MQAKTDAEVHLTQSAAATKEMLQERVDALTVDVQKEHKRAEQTEAANASLRSENASLKAERARLLADVKVWKREVSVAGTPTGAPTH